MATYDTTDGVLADTILYVESQAVPATTSDNGTRRKIVTCVKSFVVGSVALGAVANVTFLAWIAYKSSEVSY